MKKKLLQISPVVMKALAQLTLLRFKPRVIGITGSVGKTSTKSAIYTVLSKCGDKRVRIAGGNLNNEIGLPLAILGDYKKPGGMLFGAGVVIRACIQLISRGAKEKYPEVLILEYGIDKPGDMDVLLEIVRPHIAVVTAVGEIPVHIEHYDGGPADVAREKGKIVEGIKYGGVAVLNADDADVVAMRNRTEKKVTTYGFNRKADIHITGFKNESNKEGPLGISFKLGVDKDSVQVKMDNVFGKSQAYSSAAATAVGLAEGIDLQTISDALAFHKGDKGRTRLISGIKGSYILDDTYNSSPESARAALDLLKSLKTKRRIAVLGDMLELGDYTEGAHAMLGKQVAEIADILITVGLRARFIAESAIKAGFPKENIESFDDADSAKMRVQEVVKTGDLVLVKGSQGMRMERIVLEIMAEPNKAKDLLVRQYGSWLSR